MKKFNYGPLLVAALLSSACGGETAGFENLDFEDICLESNTGFCLWDVSYQVRTDISADSGQYGKALQINNENGVGFVEQELVFGKPPEESILTFSAAIKTHDVVGKGAGLTIGVYDAENSLIHNADMGYGNFSYATGTRDWAEYSIQAVVAAEAASVKIGFINYGIGKALFDQASATFLPIKDRKASPLAETYVSAAIDSVRVNSLRLDSVDFESIRRKALQIAGDAKVVEDNHLAIRYVLSALGDHHSFFMTANERRRWEQDSDVNPASRVFSTSRMVDVFGYVSVPGFHSNDPGLKIAFADTLQQQLKRLYSQGIRGWIVDLRNNDGGNMAPMLAGLEPLFSSDTLGYLIDVSGQKEAWGRGESFRRADDEYVVVDDPFAAKNRLPIAVLFGSNTGSSGEIVIISFIENASTRSFGRPSMGLTTGNGEFELPDGSYMYAASTRMADRNGKVYSGRIVPDTVVDVTSDADEDVNAAISWLREQY